MHPSPIWFWIKFVNIIDTFLLGLACPYSYHHNAYVFHVKWALHFFWFIQSQILHYNLTYIFNILFLVFFFFSYTRWWEKLEKYSHSFVWIHNKKLKNIKKNTHNSIYIFAFISFVFFFSFKRWQKKLIRDSHLLLLIQSKRLGDIAEGSNSCPLNLIPSKN